MSNLFGAILKTTDELILNADAEFNISARTEKLNNGVKIANCIISYIKIDNKKIYQVASSGKIISKELALYDAALCIAKIINSSVSEIDKDKKIKTVLFLEQKYASALNDLLVFKTNLNCKNISPTRKELFEIRYEDALIKAQSSKKEIEKLNQEL